MTGEIEIVPAILRRTLEGIYEDWGKIEPAASHIQLDVTDGVFAGDGTFQDIQAFKKLPNSHKIELHMMVQNPALFADAVADLAPARCVFHIEAFAGHESVAVVYDKLRRLAPQTQLGLAVNPDTPSEYLDEHMSRIDYALFMGYTPGFAGQQVLPKVFPKIGAFHGTHPDIPIAVDGQVTKETIPDFVHAGARILCANSSIFKKGNPIENLEQLKLLARIAI